MSMKRLRTIAVQGRLLFEPPPQPAWSELPEET
jgi:hypothetical protein